MGESGPSGVPLAGGAGLQRGDARASGGRPSAECGVNWAGVLVFGPGSGTGCGERELGLGCFTPGWSGGKKRERE